MLVIHPTHMKLYVAALILLCCCCVTPQLLAKTLKCSTNSSSILVKNLSDCSDWECEPPCNKEDDIELTLKNADLKGDAANIKFPDNLTSLFLDNVTLDGSTADLTFPSKLESLSMLNITLKGSAANLTLPSKLVKWTAVDCNLTGALDTLLTLSSLSKLTNLEYLNLSSNNLSGPLPKDWSKLTALKNISLDHNPKLNGTIPTAWSNMMNIQLLSLVGNTNVNGTVLPPKWKSEMVRTKLPAASPPVLLPSPKMQHPPPAYRPPVLTADNSSAPPGPMDLAKLPLAHARGTEDPNNERAFRFIAMVAGSLVVIAVAGVTVFVLVRHYKHKRDESVLNAKKKPLIEAEAPNHVAIKVDNAQKMDNMQKV